MTQCLAKAIIPIVFLGGILLSSCEMPSSDHNSPKPDTYEVHIIHSDGTGDRILATGNYALGVLTDSTVILKNGLNGLSFATYTGANVVPLYPGMSWWGASRSQDGKKVLLTSWVYPPGGCFLYLMDANGSNLTKLAAPMGSYGSATLAPQMDEVAFINSTGLHTMSSDGSNLRLIRRSTDSAYCNSPLYVDEDRIVYAEDSTDLGATHLPLRSIRLFDKTSRKDTSIFSHSNLFYMVDECNPLVGDLLLCKDNLVRMFDFRSGTLTTLADGIIASFSSDGSMVVVVGSDQKSIFTLDMSNHSTQTVYTEPDPKKWIDFAEISPDRKFIVFLAVYQLP